ncbi:MAG: geranylgeranylglyceryl/heptaprenylglyceryl phosphate synthase [Flavobacteriales bacterium]|nr:geranylgeranylglyceryl/heptaprenylglyceryl phosphate synthase [Flavobacteriales bacterium]
MIQEQLNNLKEAQKKGLAVLIDPDKMDQKSLQKRIKLCNVNQVDFIFIGGSLVAGNSMDDAISEIKQLTSIPVIIFPGSVYQISKKADALLFLSLVSGRNPEYLIGNQVIAAPYIKKLGIEALSTAYMLIDAGAMTTASYISGSAPIPANKPSIALATAQASELLGFRNVYLDAGSGAQDCIGQEMINKVAREIKLPLIVGGGITNPEKIKMAWEAGADVVVVGNAIELRPSLIQEFSEIKFSL